MFFPLRTSCILFFNGSIKKGESFIGLDEGIVLGENELVSEKYSDEIQVGSNDIATHPKLQGVLLAFDDGAGGLCLPVKAIGIVEQCDGDAEVVVAVCSLEFIGRKKALSRFLADEEPGGRAAFRVMFFADVYGFEGAVG